MDLWTGGIPFYGNQNGIDRGKAVKLLIPWNHKNGTGIANFFIASDAYAPHSGGMCDTKRFRPKRATSFEILPRPE